MRHLSLIAVLALLATIILHSGSANAGKDKVIIEYDKFKNEKTIRTPLRLSRQGFTDKFPVEIAFTAQQANNKLKSIRLYVVATRTDWGFFHSAIGENGYKFRFHEVDRQVGSGGGITTVKEHFALDVPINQLKAMSGKDFEIKVYGKRDGGVFRVPAATTRAFLSALSSQ